MNRELKEQEWKWAKEFEEFLEDRTVVEYHNGMLTARREGFDTGMSFTHTDCPITAAAIVNRYLNKAIEQGRPDNGLILKDTGFGRTYGKD